VFIPAIAVASARQVVVKLGWQKPDGLAILTAEMKRKILIILSNRYNRTQKPRCLELDCDDQGNILKQRRLRGLPAQPRYHEVWENDEGRTEFDSCHTFRRHYRHKLQKARQAEPLKRAKTKSAGISRRTVKRA